MVGVIPAVLHEAATAAELFAVSGGRVEISHGNANPFADAVVDLSKYYGEPVHVERAPPGPDECMTAGAGIPAARVPTKLTFSFVEGTTAHDGLGGGLEALLAAWKASGHAVAWKREDLGVGKGFRLVQTERLTEKFVVEPWESPLGTRITMEASAAGVETLVERILAAVPGAGIEGGSGLLAWSLDGGVSTALSARDEPARDVLVRALDVAGPGNAYTLFTGCYSGTQSITLRGVAGYGRWVLGEDGTLSPPAVEGP